MSDAFTRVHDSLDEASRLSESGYYGAALVWAVRSVEIHVKEFLLAPLYLTKTHGNWPKAVKHAARLFGPSNWDAAYAEVERLCGPIAPLGLTDSGVDAWEHWHKSIARRRGDIVHGRPDSEPDEDEAESVIAYARKLVGWLALRMAVDQPHPHPFRAVFYDLYHAVFDAHWGEGEWERRHGDDPQEKHSGPPGDPSPTD